MKECKGGEEKRERMKMKKKEKKNKRKNMNENDIERRRMDGYYGNYRSKDK